MWQEGIQYNETVTMVTVECCACGTLFGMSSSLNKHLRNSPDTLFYCPNGHGQHYKQSVEKQARERAERLLREKEQQLIEAANSRLLIEKELRKKERQLKKVKNGVCPCCNRSFDNLHRHMKKQHPEFTNPKP